MNRVNITIVSDWEETNRLCELQGAVAAGKRIRADTLRLLVAKVEKLGRRRDTKGNTRNTLNAANN